jgi:ribonuclease HI
MIQENNDRDTNKHVKNQFRRRGPLDAYIYKEGRDEEDVEEIKPKPAIVHTLHMDTKEASDLPNDLLNMLSGNVNKTHIFTDGACTNNGKKNANAAWGCLVVADSQHRVLDRLSGAIPKSEPQTNQRAELQALLKGLEVAEKITGLVYIWSDSQYAINCASVWGPSWRKKNWTKQGGPIQHLDLVKQLVERTGLIGRRLEYKWLKGHKANSEHTFPWMFNHQVDALATSALV